MHILLSVFTNISYGISWENLYKHQDFLCSLIISFNLVTIMFDQLVIS